MTREKKDKCPTCIKSEYGNIIECLDCYEKRNPNWDPDSLECMWKGPDAQESYWRFEQAVQKSDQDNKK